jgi:transcriptional regulator GlxA family with amidase domain
MKVRRVVFLTVSPVQILDLTAPFEVFARCGGYHVELASSSDTGLVTSSSGLTLTGAVSYRRLRGPIDTLLLPGGDGAEGILCDGDFLSWLRKTSYRVRRICSVCTGAFLLAAAGILDGHRAVTHWRWCSRLQQQFPNVKVERDPIFIRDECVYTSAGVTAGLDLALALVEEDRGSQRALEIARDLVMFLRRPGGQAQFSGLLAAQASGHRPIQELQSWIVEHLSEDLSVAALAARCRMSPRHFARVFVAELGVTPAHFVEQARVEVARLLLQSSAGSLKEVASRSGFGGPDSMRRSFLRTVGVAPSDYSARFRRQAG